MRRFYDKTNLVLKKLVINGEADEIRNPVPQNS